MQLLTVVLGRPGTIGFATGLAHPRAPNLWGKQGWYTGQGIIAWDLTHGNYGSTTWTDSFVDSLLGNMVDRRCDHTYAAAAARRSRRRMARTPCRAPPWSPARAAPLGWAARGPRCGQARQATRSEDVKAQEDDH